MALEVEVGLRGVAARAAVLRRAGHELLRREEPGMGITILVELELRTYLNLLS